MLLSTCRRYEFNFAKGPDAVGMASGATIHTANGLRMRVTRRQAPQHGQQGAQLESSSTERAKRELSTVGV